MIKGTLLVILLISLLVGSALADKVELEDGTVIVGTVTSETDDLVIIETEKMGTLELKRTEIAFITFKDSERVPYSRYGELSPDVKKLRFVGHDPDYNTIMFCPTTETLDKGDKYFRNFELFFLNFGYGLTDKLSISVAGLFPIAPSVLLVSGGLKYEVLDRTQHPLGLAVAGGYMFTKNTTTGMLNIIAGIGDRERSLNLSLSKTFNSYSDDTDLIGDQSAESGWLYCLGADWRLSQGMKVIVEYCDSADWTLEFDEDDDDLFKGLVNVGIRWFGSDWSFSLTGFRPLVEDTGSFIAFPMAMFSKHF
ncbi:MAG: hypothetical protein GY835_27065 [bacterium]|nr:hypothetical protein [bacterium]